MKKEAGQVGLLQPLKARNLLTEQGYRTHQTNGHGQTHRAGGEQRPSDYGDLTRGKAPTALGYRRSENSDAARCTSHAVV